MPLTYRFQSARNCYLIPLKRAFREMNTFADPWVRVLTDGGRKGSLGVDFRDRMVTGLTLMIREGIAGYKAFAREIPETMSAQTTRFEALPAGCMDQEEEA